MRNVILVGDVRERLRELPPKSVHTCISSPPYWGLRDYGVDGQIGLEPTPEAFVSRMVEVYREVWRVLRDDGTCWVNLGDSYAHAVACGGGSPVGDRKYRETDAEKQRKMKYAVPVGLKEKDLVGIPWRVARALQEPYYTGKIKNEADRVWLAAMIDGEGCMFIHRRKAGMSNGQGYVRKHDSYGAGLEVANTHREIVERCLSITGVGSICTVERESRMKNRNIQLHRWSLRSNQCRDIVREVYPYLVGKQHEARLLLGCPSSGPDAERAHTALIDLHNGRANDFDFDPPPSLYEPGWYLRSDIIWSKANPMPESVTDRPTKAHEYLFLLTKSPRYYYDAEAVREPAIPDPRDKLWGTTEQTSRHDHAHDAEMGMHQTRTQAEGFVRMSNPNGRNRRTVWTIATEPFPGAHFATFPRKLVEPCILAGCPEKCCPDCGAPWVREVSKTTFPTQKVHNGVYDESSGFGKSGWLPGKQRVETLGFQPSCTCGLDPVPGICLDPFFGSGTVGVVALKNRRSYIGIELNPEYAELARRRIEYGTVDDEEVAEIEKQLTMEFDS